MAAISDATVLHKSYEKKKTNYNRNSKPKACKIADLETPISTLVQSEGTNQPEEKKQRKKRKLKKILYTCIQVKRGGRLTRLQFTASITISLMDLPFLQKLLEDIQL